MSFGSIIDARRGSFMTLAFTWSRCRRDLKTIHENHTTSLGLSFTLCGNDVTLPGFVGEPRVEREAEPGEEFDRALQVAHGSAALLSSRSRVAVIEGDLGKLCTGRRAEGDEWLSHE